MNGIKGKLEYEPSGQEGYQVTNIEALPNEINKLEENLNAIIYSTSHSQELDLEEAIILDVTCAQIAQMRNDAEEVIKSIILDCDSITVKRVIINSLEQHIRNNIDFANGINYDNLFSDTLSCIPQLDGTLSLDSAKVYSELSYELIAS